MRWKILSSKKIIENNFFVIHEDRCQKENLEIIDKYYTIERPDVAVICGFTTQKELILIEQYRHPVKSVDFEVPAGYIEKSDKDILEAAKREFLEETGFSVGEIKKIKTTFASSGLMSNQVHYFIAFDCKKTQEQNLDYTEEINVHITKWEDVLNLLAEEKIKDMASVSAILLAKNFLQNPDD